MRKRWSDEAQDKIASLLEKEFGPSNIETQWRSHDRNKDWLRFGEIYCPYPDIAVKPFNTTPDRYDGIDNIKAEFDRHHKFFESFFRYSGGIDPLQNGNPRCLICIEIEGSGTRKYMMGNFLNASILGYIGFVISNENIINNAKQVKEYLDGAAEIKKMPRVAQNVMLFEHEDFLDKLTKLLI